MDEGFWGRFPKKDFGWGRFPKKDFGDVSQRDTSQVEKKDFGDVSQRDTSQVENPSAVELIGFGVKT